jgi:hypothetical protein
MADDRMKNDDLQRNMGSGEKDKNYGQQSPGRAGQGGHSGEKAGQHAGGQHSGGQQSGQQQGGQKGMRNTEDDEEDFGTGKAGTQNRGGQNR